jgi:hypothetical protein
MAASSPTTPYIAATVPAAIARVSNTTLFHLAAFNFGDALWWTDIAALNDLVDPWVMGQAEIEIPPVPPSGTPTGILMP